MKYLLLSLLLLTGCSAMTPKKTDFYKDGRLVKTIYGRGVFDGDDWTGINRIWALKGNGYYQYKCPDCTIIETELKK